jgi:hypothetical protein
MDDIQIEGRDGNTLQNGRDTADHRVQGAVAG